MIEKGRNGEKWVYRTHPALCSLWLFVLSIGHNHDTNQITTSISSAFVISFCSALHWSSERLQRKCRWQSQVHLSPFYILIVWTQYTLIVGCWKGKVLILLLICLAIPPQKISIFQEYACIMSIFCSVERIFSCTLTQRKNELPLLQSILKFWIKYAQSNLSWQSFHLFIVLGKRSFRRLFIIHFSQYSELFPVCLFHSRKIQFNFSLLLSSFPPHPAISYDFSPFCFFFRLSISGQSIAGLITLNGIEQWASKNVLELKYTLLLCRW